MITDETKAMMMSNCLNEHFALRLGQAMIINIFVDGGMHIWHRKHIIDIFLNEKLRFVKNIW